MIKKSKKGWIVETSGYSEHFMAYMEGASDGDRLLLYYDKFKEVQRDANLDAFYNDYYTNGEYLEQMAIDFEYDKDAIKVLNRGTIIR